MEEFGYQGRRLGAPFSLSIEPQELPIENLGLIFVVYGVLDFRTASQGDDQT